jgi:hypothetical protein
MASTSAYECVGSPPEAHSYQHAVTCELPVVFACVVEFRKRGERLFGNSVAVLKADLQGASPLVATLDLSDVIPADAWVSQLLRATDTGNLEAVVAFRNGLGEGNVNTPSACSTSPGGG